MSEQAASRLQYRPISNLSRRGGRPGQSSSIVLSSSAANTMSTFQSSTYEQLASVVSSNPTSTSSPLSSSGMTRTPSFVATVPNTCFLRSSRDRRLRRASCRGRRGRHAAHGAQRASRSLVLERSGWQRRGGPRPAPPCRRRWRQPRLSRKRRSTRRAQAGRSGPGHDRRVHPKSWPRRAGGPTR